MKSFQNIKFFIKKAFQLLLSAWEEKTSDCSFISGLSPLKNIEVTKDLNFKKF